MRRRVGKRVKDLRLARNLTQEQLGERASLSYKFVGEVERGIGNPTLDTLASLAAALGVEIVDLVSDGRTITYGDVSDRDVAVVRDARDSLEAILARFGGRSKKRRR
ncbi:MAG TPA: helix-turn-helix transcriptional regulator [Vicinamibacterales bacterium]|jgi:transcriptional regulator with XRE-family HTH domain|nr:helix-turn-helix transcriptional regulator [Vicinamibacterales bacterium]